MKTSAPLPPLTSTVSMPSPPSLRSLPSPGFQIMRSSPASPNTWSLPVPPVSVSLPSPPNSRSLPPLPSSVSLPAWPNSRSSPEPPVSVSLPAPPNRLRGRQRAVGFVERDRVVAGLAEDLDPGRVGDGRRAADDATAPPLTSRLPAALRLSVIVLLALSPIAVRMPAAGLKVAVTAIAVAILSSLFRSPPGAVLPTGIDGQPTFVPQSPL